MLTFVTDAFQLKIPKYMLTKYLFRSELRVYTLILKLLLILFLNILSMIAEWPLIRFYKFSGKVFLSLRSYWSPWNLVPKWDPSPQCRFRCIQGTVPGPSPLLPVLVMINAVTSVWTSSCPSSISISYKMLWICIQRGNLFGPIVLP